MSDFIKKNSDLTNKKILPSMLWNYISHIGSRVGIFFTCMFIFISGFGMWINMTSNRMTSIYDVKYAYNRDLLNALDISPYEYYNLLFMASNAKNNNIEFSSEYIDEYIKSLPKFQDEEGQKLSKKFGENLKLNVQIKLQAQVMKYLIDKLNQSDDKAIFSKKMPSRINASFYYVKNEITANEKQYFDYLVTILYNEASVVFYDLQERLGYVLEVDETKAEILKSLIDNYNTNNIKEDLYLYLVRELKSFIKVHKFNSFVSFGDNSVSNLLFTDDRKIAEINGKFYVPITNNVRSARIKNQLTKEDKLILNSKAEAMMRNDKLILFLNDLLNKYNSGKIDLDYFKENCNSYTANVEININSLMNLDMFLGAQDGDVFIIGNEAGSDIPCIAVINFVEYSQEDESAGFIENILKSGGYLIHNAASNFIK